jgi:hypothetical protein
MIQVITPEFSSNPSSKSDITVKELIKVLSTLDQNKKISIYTTEWPGETIQIAIYNDSYELYPYTGQI